ncbi:bifunctional diguanylate cyclase/phosphodiesterase [Paraburkholderia acidisoli]|uniref:EAL domain-containing protein n=1 Tax=Paraburkholderia acidisoli TaxID=2571748 RepID=A0A7Z2GNL4_9BURK|nr:bifunctional diguanylate cyclase/phosphodiesterase [Paraburkholderia acidisoli]QGZ64870.1 EAL domain-containing protein [Paraburkholderia acidisoli]
MRPTVFPFAIAKGDRKRFHDRSLDHQRPLSFGTMMLSIGAYVLFAVARATLVAAPFPLAVSVTALVSLALLVMAIPRTHTTAQFGLVGVCYVVIMQMAANELVAGTLNPLAWMLPAVVAIMVCAAPLWLTPAHFITGSICYYAATLPFFFGLHGQPESQAIFLVWVAISFMTACVFHFGFYRFRYRHFQLEQQLTSRADTDPLTGVKNRRAFLDAATARVEASQRAKHGLMLLLIDVDLFKSINEQFGYGAGDKALQNVANAIVETAPVPALSARMGGEEFVVLVDENALTSPAEFAEAMRAAIARVPRPDGYVSASIGAARLTPEDTIASLLERADEALFRARQAGRNQVAFERGRTLVPVRNTASSGAASTLASFAPLAAPPHDASREAATPTRWRNATLVSHFQPLWSLPRETLVGVEALLRGEDDAGNLVAPATLFAGLTLAELGELDVLSHACHLRNASGRLPAGARLFLNILPSTFVRAGYENELARMADEAGLDPRNIVLELLESDDASPDALSLAANRYRDCGFLIAVDDFGARYSNLDRLLRIQPDLVKLDGELIRARNRRSGRPLLRDLVMLLHQADIAVVVEGVETTEELVLTVESKVDIVQGFLLGRPTASLSPPALAPARIDHAFDVVAESRSVRMCRFDMMMQPLLDTLAQAAAHVRAGMPFAGALEELRAGALCVRVFALGPLGRPALYEAHGAANACVNDGRSVSTGTLDGRWDHRAFFWKAARKQGRAIYSGPMLSPLTHCLCIIASIAIEMHGEQILLAAELDWASPELPWPEAA